jgi:hypothetical protein
MRKVATAQSHAKDALSEATRLIVELAPKANLILERSEGDEREIKIQLDALLKGSSRVGSFLETYFSSFDDVDTATTLKRKSSALALLRESLLKGGLDTTAEKISALAEEAFQEAAISESQSHVFNEERLPEMIRQYLPSNIVIDLDPYGQVEGVSDLYGNENKDLSYKIQRMKFIVENYNEFVSNVRADIRSTDAKMSMLGTITALIMETGIRPSAGGSSAVKSDGKILVDDAGEKVYMETFGALSLRFDHVPAVGILEFPGKAGTMNTAVFDDELLSEALEALVMKAQMKSSGLDVPGFLFTLKDGTRVSDKMLKTYFAKRLKGVDPTDFRKLRATRAVFESLRSQQEDLLKRIKLFVLSATDDLKERASKEIAKVINNAYLEAQKALSHEDVSTTVGAYINPTVVLSYITRGGLADTFEEAILTQPARLTFDPELFISQAKEISYDPEAFRHLRTARLLRASVGLVGRRNASLLEVIENLESDLGERTSSLLDTITSLETALDKKASSKRSYR